MQTASYGSQGQEHGAVMQCLACPEAGPVSLWGLQGKFRYSVGDFLGSMGTCIRKPSVIAGRMGLPSGWAPGIRCIALHFCPPLWSLPSPATFSLLPSAGVTGSVTINNVPLVGFTIYSLEMKPDFFKRYAPSSTQYRLWGIRELRDFKLFTLRQRAKIQSTEVIYSRLQSASESGIEP